MMVSRFFCIDKQSENFLNKMILFCRRITTPGVAKRYIDKAKAMKEAVNKARILDMSAASHHDRIVSRYAIKVETADLMTLVLNAHRSDEFTEEETRELCTLLMQIDAIANEEIDMVIDPDKYEVSEEAKVVANRIFRYRAEKRKPNNPPTPLT